MRKKKLKALLNKSFNDFRRLKGIEYCSKCNTHLKATDTHHFLCNKCWKEQNGIYNINRRLGLDYEQKYNKYIDRSF